MIVIVVCARARVRDVIAMVVCDRDVFVLVCVLVCVLVRACVWACA